MKRAPKAKAAPHVPSASAKSGYRGVYKLNRGWVVEGRQDGKPVYLGKYHTKKAAVEAYAHHSHEQQQKKKRTVTQRSSGRLREVTEQQQKMEAAKQLAAEKHAQAQVQAQEDADSDSDSDDLSALWHTPPKQRALPRGVYKLNGTRYYTVLISVAGKKVSRGSYASVEEAKAEADKVYNQMTYAEGYSGKRGLDWLLGQPKYKKRKKRKGWTPAEKKKIVQRQHGLCALQYRGCSQSLLPMRIEFDHKDGDRANNSLDNAQATCKNCHGVKSAADARKRAGRA